MPGEVWKGEPTPCKHCRNAALMVLAGELVCSDCYGQLLAIDLRWKGWQQRMAAAERAERKAAKAARAAAADAEGREYGVMASTRGDRLKTFAWGCAAVALFLAIAEMFGPFAGECVQWWFGGCQ
jgi:hypothetical protein